MSAIYTYDVICLIIFGGNLSRFVSYAILMRPDRAKHLDVAAKTQAYYYYLCQQRNAAQV